MKGERKNERRENSKKNIGSGMGMRGMFRDLVPPWDCFSGNFLGSTDVSVHCRSRYGASVTGKTVCFQGKRRRTDTCSDVAAVHRMYRNVPDVAVWSNPLCGLCELLREKCPVK